MRFGSPAISFVYHLGVHCTDESQLVRSLMKNGAELNKQKVILPRPRRYRTIVGDVTNKYRGKPIPDSEQKRLFEAILLDNPAERVILSDENYLCMPQKIFDYGQLYGKTAFRSTWVRNLFPDNPCEFFLALRNPATLIPAAFRASGEFLFEKFICGANPREMLWSRVIQDLQENNPGCPVTVWCNEDTPLIWPTVLREISDAGPDMVLDGEMDVLQSIMTEDGFQRMTTYLASHQPASEIQRRRVFAAFLDKFVIDEELEEDIDLPDWTAELVDEVTARYDDDVYRIERMSGVNFITT